MTYSAPQPTTPEEDTWWVQQWVDLLNSYRFKKRLERGRNYARQGHILSLTFKNAKVHAKVQGTASDPYQLSIWIDQFTDEDWSYVINTLSEKALYSAQLLAGEMPDDIERVFTSNGLSLFPFTLADVNSKCSCPDPKNPCKHIAAVYYQLGDFFREDPFVLFQLRGRSKEQILEALRQHRHQAINASEALETTEVTAEDTEQKKTTAQKKAAEEKEDNQQKAGSTKASSKKRDAQKTDSKKPNSSPPPIQIEKFWQYNEPLDSSLVVVTPAEQTVLEVIGDMPLAATEAQVVTTHLKALYQTVAQQAMMSALS